MDKMIFTPKYNHLFGVPIKLSNEDDGFLGLQVRKNLETKDVYLVITKFFKYKDNYLPDKANMQRLSPENFNALIDSAQVIKDALFDLSK